jgi:hypothetical protein
MAVTFISGGQTGRSFVYDGITFYEWSWMVNVDGQVGVYTEWVDTTDPAAAEGSAVEDLENNPDDLGGIAQNDGNPDEPGDGRDDGPEQDGDDDDGGDGALAGGGDGYGDSA